MTSTEEIKYPYGKYTLIFNVLILVLSVSLMLLIVLVWNIWDYHFMLAYTISTLASLLCLYFIKLTLLRGSSSDGMEEISDVQEPMQRSEGGMILKLFVVVLLILAIPLLTLFFYPELWLMIMNGFLAGASISELLLYFRKRK